jgi:multidrug efflux system membrane fusion protein
MHEGGSEIQGAGQVTSATRAHGRRAGVALIMLVALAQLLMFFGQHADSKDKESEPAAVLSVTVARVLRQDVPIVLQALGTVTPLSTVTVRSQISGYLTKVAANEGEIVHKGDFLAQIDERPYRASLEQAQGQMLRDAALLKNARLDLARYQRLIAQDSTSHQLLDTAQATVSQYEGAVRSDRAQMEMQRLNLEYCRIVAPGAGRVGLRQVDAGNFIQPTDATGLMVITQIQPISVILILPQAQLGRVLKRFHEGARLAVTAFDGEGSEMLATGALASVDNEIDTSTGTVKLRAVFVNADETLFPNQFVNVHLDVDTVRNAVTIPVAAVRHGESGDAVFVVGSGGLVHSRRIVAGPQYRGRILVSAGLTPGERVVTDGIGQLDEGIRVATTDSDRLPGSGQP